MPFKGRLGGVKGVEKGYEVVDVDFNVLKASLTGLGTIG
jgi:hypothetical protein